MDCGEYHPLVPDLLEDGVKCFQYFRMTHENFTVFLHLLKPDISTENTSFREAVGPKERLSICLRCVCIYFASNTN
jgi:hypothetical protein